MKIFFAVLCFGLVALCGAHSPVVMWPANEFELKDGLSPMETLTSERFEKMISKKNIVVFTKRRFSLEDLSFAVVPPPYLDSQDLMALQSVQNLHRFLKGLKDANKIEVVPLKDDDILKNDDVIRQTMEQHKGYAALLVSTGSHPISKRAVVSDKTAACSKRPSDKEDGNKCALVYIGDIKIGGVAPKEACEVTCNDTKSDTTITFGNTTITIQPDQEGYNFTIEEYTANTEIVWFPQSYSYSCGTLRFNGKKPSDKKPTVEITGFQVMISETASKFNDRTWSCSPWVTTPIVMGFIVVIFYLFILFGAVLFLLDIKTNDRFDDPKGKTITVNVSE